MVRAGDKRTRLLGFERTVLKAGETKRVTVTADPRLLERFDPRAGRWRIEPGGYRIALGASAVDIRLHAETRPPARLFGA